MSSLPQASESGSSPQTCDQSTATDLDDVSIPATNEDLSLPLSIDSGLDLSSDYKKARVTEGRAWLAQLSRATGEAEAAASTTSPPSSTGWPPCPPTRTMPCPRP
ncbi:hypothetical protein C7M84_003852 [Penaeus vannamei]|uniref:Uncharacterized protein n=1 Tax=Penaeus vannamei TaxID=6689 RepID=A0A3R7P7B9_PENVA|nr:hypothetical protein C7M84_003852 [Penaeus vannamei]